MTEINGQAASMMSGQNNFKSSLATQREYNETINATKTTKTNAKNFATELQKANASKIGKLTSQEKFNKATDIRTKQNFNSQLSNASNDGIDFASIEAKEAAQNFCNQAAHSLLEPLLKEAFKGYGDSDQNEGEYKFYKQMFAAKIGEQMAKKMNIFENVSKIVEKEILSKKNGNTQ